VPAWLPSPPVTQPTRLLISWLVRRRLLLLLLLRALRRV